MKLKIFLIFDILITLSVASYSLGLLMQTRTRDNYKPAPKINLIITKELETQSKNRSNNL